MATHFLVNLVEEGSSFQIVSHNSSLVKCQAKVFSIANLADGSPVSDQG